MFLSVSVSRNGASTVHFRKQSPRYPDADVIHIRVARDSGVPQSDPEVFCPLIDGRAAFEGIELGWYCSKVLRKFYCWLLIPLLAIRDIKVFSSEK